MNVDLQPTLGTAERRLPFECVALVLQGGGALGAYQAGVYEALAEADINPDWVAGVSIGAVNSAIIAGNKPAERVEKLRSFWEEITANPLLDWATAARGLTPKGHLPRTLFNQLSASCAMLSGAAGFFSLRQPAPRKRSTNHFYLQGRQGERGSVGSASYAEPNRQHDSQWPAPSAVLRSTGPPMIPLGRG